MVKRTLWVFSAPGTAQENSPLFWQSTEGNANSLDPLVPADVFKGTPLKKNSMSLGGLPGSKLQVSLTKLCSSTMTVEECLISPSTVTSIFLITVAPIVTETKFFKIIYKKNVEIYFINFFLPKKVLVLLVKWYCLHIYFLRSHLSEQ
jgi:hypothetical protein